VLGHLANAPEICSRELSRLVTVRARANDSGQAKDDTTCAVIHFRVPRELLVVSGPPIDREKDRDLADLVREFSGKRIVCGGTTANIIARELARSLTVDIASVDPEIPPPSRMDGIDLVTEGILTLGRVAELLEQGDGPETVRRVGRENAADRLVAMLLAGDRIRFVIGTKINEAHQDPNIPVELEIRRNVVKKIARLLEEKYLKDVGVRFV
jgi:hypothetical protein